MNINKFTEKAQEAVVAAQNLATEQNHAEVTPEHLLVTLVEQSGGIVPSILQKLKLEPGRVAGDARALLKNLQSASPALRQAAAKALGTIKDATSLAILSESLASTNPERLHAWYAAACRVPAPSLVIAADR